MADRKKVVVVGGGIGGAYVARHLEDSLDVTLIDSKDYFEVRWATLRAVVEPAVATKCIWSHTDYLKKAKVVVDDVVGLTPSEVQTKGSQAYPYDYLVIATGSKGAEQKTTAERRGHFVKLRERLDKASKVLVVGGGPVGVELAAEIATDFPTKHVTLVHSGSRLCEFMTEGAAAKALTWLKKNKVGVLLNDRVELDATVAGGPTELIPNEGTRVFTTAKGTEVHADMWYKATGDRIHTEWIRNTHIGSSLNDKGELRVEDTLVVSGTENVFAVGDVVGFQTPKQGYLALEEGKVAVANIKTLASGRGSGSSAAALKKYKPKADVAILTLGRNNGVLQTPIGSFTGLLPKVIKSKGLFISKLRGDLRMRC